MSAKPVDRFTQKEAPIAVIGGGIIGLSVGWQLLRRGYSVTLFDRQEPGRAASWAAAGMLAPHAEVGFEEEDFLKLALASLEAYPRYLSELSADSGTHITMDECGTLVVAFNRDDTERIRRLFEYREQLRLPAQWLVGREAREIEPMLSPKVTAAMWLPKDGQINNREVLDALKTAFVSRGGALKPNTTATAVRTSNGRVTHVRSDDGVAIRASRIVVAAGAWSAGIEGIPEAMRPPVRPVKGQIVSLRMPKDFALKKVIRTPDAYLLPKNDGRLVVGATQEEMGFDTAPTAGAVLRLLERGWEAVPAIYDLEIESLDVGLRPGSRDNAPIVGASAIDNLYYATGHFRHGIILAPITAYSLADLIAGKAMPDCMRSADPARFTQPLGKTDALDHQRDQPEF